MTVNYKEMMRAEAGKRLNVRDELQTLPHRLIMKEQPKLGYAVCVLNLLGSLNIGSIIRSSVIFGADIVYIAGRSRWDGRTSVGADNYIEVSYIDAMASPTEVDTWKALQRIENEGYTPVLVELGGVPIQNFKSPSVALPCFVFGNEGAGIPQDVLSSGKYPVVSINQMGVLRSLNVSNAASIILYEYTKNVTTK